MRRREWLRIAGMTTGAAALGAAWGLRGASAAPPHAHFFHQQRTCSRCGVPRDAGYGKDDEAARGIILASADPVRSTSWRTGTGEAKEAARKPFHVHGASVAAAAVSLQQVALCLYGTGRLVSSGRLVHTGGPDGSLRGNNVTIRLHAYCAPAVDIPEALPVDSTAVWHSERSLWVARNQPVVIPMTKKPAETSDELLTFFNEITHFEIELIAHRDR